MLFSMVGSHKRRGFYISPGNATGCLPCLCHTTGAVNDICNSLTGQCICRDASIAGQSCDRCKDLYFGFDPQTGSKDKIQGKIHKIKGPDQKLQQQQQKCTKHNNNKLENHLPVFIQPKQNIYLKWSSDAMSIHGGPNIVVGRGKVSFYRDIKRANDVRVSLCQPCNCHLSGALNETCHLVTGQCFCKRFVTGSKCDACVPSASHLDVNNLLGCSKTPSQQPPPRGKVQSSSAINLSWSPPDSPNAHWLTYSLFRDGFEIYTTEDQYPYNRTQHELKLKEEGCEQTMKTIFASRIFTKIFKELVESQLLRPVVFKNIYSDVLDTDSKSSLKLMETLNFMMQIAKGNEHLSTSAMLAKHPKNLLLECLFSSKYQHDPDIQYFLDTALSPYTSYSYYIETTNVHGSTRSAAVTYRTRPGVPEGRLNLSYIPPVSSDSVTLYWTAPSNRSGPIEKYILSCAPIGGIQPCVPYEGHETSATVWNLAPFTKYHFSVQACTSGGCLHSSPLTVTTAQAPPRRLGPPEVRKISATELHVEWSPPMEPNGRNSRPRFPFLGKNMNENLGMWKCAVRVWQLLLKKWTGIIIRYELYMKRLRSNGETTPAQRQVFQSSGWLSPQPFAESANENALKPPQTTTTITGLEPYTTYEFRVLAVNMAGTVSSAWTSERTGESAPVFMARPSVFPLSPYSLNVSWEKPADNDARGKVVGYNINMISEQSPQQLLPMVFSQVFHAVKSQDLYYIVKGLKPYRIYNFTISLCNSIGCVTSASGAGQTLAAGTDVLKLGFAKISLAVEYRID
ncbi:hypothetical protein HPG69_010194 [Diceros bicornis minor]|uniref:Uncharacterized protein n=1 Tax=Diceros bicornis minor TaxID=77932 RepID=A0A7J7EE25_DICBM|nr:hypothetical protein HPG69_010194 [Diceros bicornis minor]